MADRRLRRTQQPRLTGSWRRRSSSPSSADEMPAETPTLDLSNVNALLTADELADLEAGLGQLGALRRAGEARVEASQLPVGRGRAAHKVGSPAHL